MGIVEKTQAKAAMGGRSCLRSTSSGRKVSIATARNAISSHPN